MDRRAFLLGGAVALALPLAGCGGGTDVPPVADQRGPTAVSGTARFQTRPEQHALVITPASGRELQVGGVGRAAGRLNFPNGVAVHEGLAFVVETGNHRVQVFDTQGRSVRSFGQETLLYPSDVAVAGGEIVVSDSRHGRIVVFSPSGVVQRILGEGMLSAPRGLATHAGMLYVADPGLRSVLRLDLAGHRLADIGADWVLPWDVATDGNHVYVADVSTHAVVVLSGQGERLDTVQLDRAPRYTWFHDGTLHIV